MITLNEAKEWLRIDLDNDQDNNLVNSLIEVSVATIKAATGVPKDFISKINSENQDDIKNLYLMAQRIIITDLYNERDTDNKALLSYYTQLELSYRRCLTSEIK